jgi:hypothetical protein
MGEGHTLAKVHPYLLHTTSIRLGFDIGGGAVSSELKVPRLLTAKELAVTLNVPLWRIYELDAFLTVRGICPRRDMKSTFR